MVKAYHVYSKQDGSWAVKQTQAVRAKSVHQTLDAAIAAARKMARTRGSELVVHERDGKVQIRESFAHHST